MTGRLGINPSLPAQGTLREKIGLIRTRRNRQISKMSRHKAQDASKRAFGDVNKSANLDYVRRTQAKTAEIELPLPPMIRCSASTEGAELMAPSPLWPLFNCRLPSVVDIPLSIVNGCPILRSHPSPFS